ncbi:MAG TPA: chorismate-binding protein, partial [Candidatus Sulfotelmatobacter sp.]|nr:chorismate-binding protein [Candidatus Sulfotelmatobacter sp.]
NVTGRLKKGEDAVDLFRAVFPAGTVSGAPKVRAMEIIDELENRKRGLYAGSVGYFSFSGELDSGIAIRTIILKGRKAYVQAGAGLVYDSVPAQEYQETVNKAKALLAAVELAA